MPLIRVNEEQKKNLDLLKKHPRETYGDVIDMLRDFYLSEKVLK